MFVCFTFVSSVINLIYLKQLILLYYVKQKTYREQHRNDKQNNHYRMVNRYVKTFLNITAIFKNLFVN